MGREQSSHSDRFRPQEEEAEEVLQEAFASSAVAHLYRYVPDSRRLSLLTSRESDLSSTGAKNKRKAADAHLDDYGADDEGVPAVVAEERE